MTVGRPLTGIRIHISSRITAVFAASIMCRPRYLFVYRPSLTAGGPVTAVLVVEAIGLHEPRLATGMGLMALGAGEGMLGVSSPPLDRFVHPVDALPRFVLGGAVGEGCLRVALEAEPGESVVVLGDPVGTAEGGPVYVSDACRQWSSYDLDLTEDNRRHTDPAEFVSE